MSLVQEFIAVISSNFFGSGEETKHKKIAPKMEIEDIELGNIDTRMIEIAKKENDVAGEFKSIIQNPDLELGFGPIIESNCGNIIIDMNGFEKSMIYENYISIIESASYLASHLKDTSDVFFKDINLSWNKKLVNSEFHVVMHIESKSMGIRLNKPSSL